MKYLAKARRLQSRRSLRVIKFSYSPHCHSERGRQRRSKRNSSLSACITYRGRGREFQAE